MEVFGGVVIDSWPLPSCPLKLAPRNPVNVTALPLMVTVTGSVCTDSEYGADGSEPLPLIES